jgi:integrase
MLGSVVARLLRDRAALAGIEGELLPHGLRAGFVTVAYAAGARDDDIMRHTRHKSVEVMRRYIRKAGLVSDSPTSLLGL